MSSQASSEVGLNAVMCYFPWFPYYQRYQIGFDILLPPDAQADPSVAQRLIHVRLYFPDGFICNPANFGGMPDPASFGSDVPQFLPPHPHFPPPMVPTHMHTNLHFRHHVPMGLPRPMMEQEQHDARVVVYVVNGQPGEFMVIDDTPYDVIPRCKVCNEFHTEPEHIHNKPKRKPSQHLPGRSRLHPSASGTVGQRNTSYAAPSTASERVATHRRSNLQKENELKLTQQMADEHQHGAHEAVQGIQHKNDTATSASNEANVATIILQIHRVVLDDQNDGRKVAQDNKQLDEDPKAETAQDNKKADADPKAEMDQDNKKPSTDPKADDDYYVVD